MSNRILINVYLEDRMTGTKDLKYSDVIVTPSTATEVVDSFEVNEGFLYKLLKAWCCLSWISLVSYFLPKR